MENKTFYIHKESCLRFDAMHLVDGCPNATDDRNVFETTDYDVTVVCLWMPNCSDTPMIIIDWYFGDADDTETLKRIVDAWCASKTAEELENLRYCQDIGTI